MGSLDRFGIVDCHLGLNRIRADPLSSNLSQVIRLNRASSTYLDELVANLGLDNPGGIGAVDGLVDLTLDVVRCLLEVRNDTSDLTCPNVFHPND